MGRRRRRSPGPESRVPRRELDFANTLRGARHQRITPYTPRHNGKVERYNRIVAEEFLYAREWTSEHQRETVA